MVTLSLPPSVPDRERGVCVWEKVGEGYGVRIYEPHLRPADTGERGSMVDGDFVHEPLVTYWAQRGACFGYYECALPF